MLELGAHTSAAGGVHNAVIRAIEQGMSACQLFTKNERQWNAKPLDPAVVDKFLTAVSEGPISARHLVAHDSYLINIASPDDAMWEKSRLALVDELHRCDQLGIPNLVSHPGAHVGSGLDAGIARVIEAVNRIHDETPSGKTRLLIETTAGQGTTLGRAFEEIAQIIDGVHDKNRVGVCLDSCHIFVAGYDIRSPETYAATMHQFDTLIGIDQLFALHLNDAKHELGSRKDRHAHIGQGEIGLEGFRSLINDTRLAGKPGVLETEKGDNDEMDQANLAALRALVGSPVAASAAS